MEGLGLRVKNEGCRIESEGLKVDVYSELDMRGCYSMCIKCLPLYFYELLASDLLLCFDFLNSNCVLCS